MSTPYISLRITTGQRIDIGFDEDNQVWLVPHNGADPIPLPDPNALANSLLRIDGERECVSHKHIIEGREYAHRHPLSEEEWNDTNVLIDHTHDRINYQ